jgi:hypothetical protein
MMRVGAVLAIAITCGCGSDDGGTPAGGDAGSGGGVDAGSGSQSVTAFCVSETNRYRAMVPVADIAESTQLDTYAATGAESDTMSGTAHGHFSDTSGGGIAFAENECPSFLGWSITPNPTDQQIKDKLAACILAWYSEGPGADYQTHGHYINMTNASYTKMGCGVYVSGSDLTITADFGN